MGEERAAERIDRLIRLRTMPGFGALSVEQLAVVAEHVRERFFRRGEVLFEEGRPLGAVHFVIDGSVSLYRGGRHFLTLGRRSTVGGLAVLARDPTGIDARALEDTVTLELPASAIREVVEEHYAIFPRVLGDVAALLVERLAEGEGTPHLPPHPPPEVAVPERPLDWVERILFLRHFPALRCAVSALADLALHVDEVRYPEGTPIWEEGARADELLLVVSGTIIGRNAEGGRRIVFARGGAAGAFESLAGRPRWYRAVAARDVVALRTDRDLLLDLFEDNLTLGLDFLAFVAEMLIRVLEHGGDAAGRWTTATYEALAPPIAGAR